MFHSRFKSLALILPLLVLSAACDRKPKVPETTVSSPSTEAPAGPATLLPRPEIKADAPYYTANTGDHWAQVEGQPGWTYEWNLEGGLLTTGMTADVIRFTVGEPGKVSLQCKITDPSTGREAKVGLEQNVVPPPLVDKFEANPPVISVGQSTALRWEIKDVESLKLAPGDHDVLKYLTLKVQPPETTTYVLTASNGAGGQMTAEVQVKVVPPPAIRSFSAEGAAKVGQAVTIRAEFADGKAEIRMGDSVLATSNESPLRLQVNPTAGTVYSLVVTNEAGTFTSMPLAFSVQALKK